jgi:hypothetical protein
MELRYGLQVSTSRHVAPNSHIQPTINQHQQKNTPTPHNNQPTPTTMPKLSFRNRKVGRLFKKWTDLRKWRLFKFALGEDPFDLFDVLAEHEAKCQFKVEVSSRYSTTSRATYRNGFASRFFWEDLNEDPPWLNDAEFKDKYQMTCCSFWLIVDLIKDHDVFKSPRKPMAPVAHQLMTLLCFLGMEGNGMSNRKARSVFRAGKGTYSLYKDRVV